MKQETQELTNLPLSFLISAPLNAAIEAQRAAALSTAAFIEQVGFNPKKKGLNLFSGNGPTDTYDVRMAAISYEHEEVVETKAPEFNADGTIKTQGVYKVNEETRKLMFPFISLFHIPMFNISELNIDFNVRLKGVTQFEADFNHETTSSFTSSANAGGDLSSIGIPLNVGASMKVESSSRTQFGLRYGEGHEAEYNLHVTAKAVQAAPTKGIEKLLALAEKIVDSSEKLQADKKEAEKLGTLS